VGRPAVSAPFHYTLCGLRDVYLLSGFRLEDTPYGPTVAIEDVDALHRSVALDLIEKRRRLTGRELRFLRSLLDLSQAALARLLETSRLTIVRWETAKDGDALIPGPLDRAVRSLYWGKATGRPLEIGVLERLTSGRDSATSKRLFRFKVRKRDWEPAALAA
jgi:DNA-binding transcriptional regulator YiaG